MRTHSPASAPGPLVRECNMPESVEKRIPKDVAAALRHLSTKNEWQLTDLPPEIGNEDLLCRLDIAYDGQQGYIEYAWSGNSAWASPYRQKPIRCSTWEQIVARKSERAFRPRIRLSELGKQTARLQEGKPASRRATGIAGEKHGWIARLSESVVAQVIGSLIVLALVGFIIFKAPWIKQFLG